MLRDAQANGTAASSRRRIRRLPKTPRPSEFITPPKLLPLDFYDVDWFLNLEETSKRRLVKVDEVAFLKNASLSLMKPREEDEKLGDRAFSTKWFDIISEPYQLVETEDGVISDVDEEEDNGGDVSIDIEKSDGEDEESEFYDEGECGDLYDQKDDDEESDDEESSDDEGDGHGMDADSD